MMTNNAEPSPKVAVLPISHRGYVLLTVRAPCRGPLLIRLVFVGEEANAATIQQVLTHKTSVGFAVLFTVYSFICHARAMLPGTEFTRAALRPSS